jgi:hypothetical protein
MFFPGSNIKCFTFHIHLWSTYLLSLVHTVDDRPINEYGAVGGMKIDWESEVLGENPPQSHHKSHMS